MGHRALIAFAAGPSNSLALEYMGIEVAFAVDDGAVAPVTGTRAGATHVCYVERGEAEYRSGRSSTQLRRGGAVVFDGAHASVVARGADARLVDIVLPTGTSPARAVMGAVINDVSELDADELRPGTLRYSLHLDSLRVMFIDYDRATLVPEHVHEHASVIYVAAGAFSAAAGDATGGLTTGQGMVVPANIAHSLVLDSPPARLVELWYPV